MIDPPLEGLDELLAECDAALPPAHYFAAYWRGRPGSPPPVGSADVCQRAGCGMPREHPVHLEPGPADF